MSVIYVTRDAVHGQRETDSAMQFTNWLFRLFELYPGARIETWTKEVDDEAGA